MCRARLKDPCKSYICVLRAVKTASDRSRGEIYSQMVAECKLELTSTWEIVMNASAGTSASRCKISPKTR